VTLLPYLGFTWANAGRYTYLPAIGFGIALAGTLLGSEMKASRQTRRRRAVGWVIVGLLILRFALFTARGARGDFAAFEPARDYFAALDRQGVVPAGGVIRVPPSADPRIDHRYIEVMVQWRFQDPALRVIVD
jgi:hypothetical protein